MRQQRRDRADSPQLARIRNRVFTSYRASRRRLHLLTRADWAVGVLRIWRWLEAVALAGESEEGEEERRDDRGGDCGEWGRPIDDHAGGEGNQHGAERADAHAESFHRELPGRALKRRRRDRRRDRGAFYGLGVMESIS